MYVPRYIDAFKTGKLEAAIRDLVSRLEACNLCPRACGVDRSKGKRGYCGVGRSARVSSYSPHFGEESPLVGRHGSGTIFMSGCNLLCIFCQNYEISHLKEGYDLDPYNIARMMLELQGLGCHNINIVTPSHVVPQILEALILAIPKGLKIPLVYNTGGYDSLDTIKSLDGIVDIYMPDFKFWSKKLSKELMNAEDYPDIACLALKEMHSQVGDLVINEAGIAERGLLVRHLVMPGCVEDSKQVLRFIAEEISLNTYVNIMDQYRPCGRAYEHPLITRRITPQEYREVLDFAKDMGLTRLDPRHRPRFFMVI